MNIQSINNQNINFKALPKYQTVVDKILVKGPAVTSPFTIRKMKQEGITQIIDLRNSSWIKRPLEKLFCKILGIKYVNHRYPHRLYTLPSDDFFQKINADIINNQGKTYIHCLKGKRRTGICVAIYEKNHSNKSKDEIVTTLLTDGFQEIKNGTKNFKTPRLESIFNDFLKKYYNN